MHESGRIYDARLKSACGENMIEVFRRSFWRGVKTTFDEARAGSPPADAVAADSVAPVSVNSFEESPPRPESSGPKDEAGSTLSGSEPRDEVGGAAPTSDPPQS